MSRALSARHVERRHYHRRRSLATHTGSAFRLYIGGNAIVSFYVALTDPAALIHLVAATAEGRALVWLVMALGAWALIDALINDVLPERFRWPIALNQRHYILVGMAFCYMAQLYIAYYTSRPTSLLVYYTWNIGAIMIVAFVDANQRAKDQACKISAA